MKTEYKLKGTRLKAGAIGKSEKFSLTVSRQTGTMTPLDAMNTARRVMYEDGFDNILFTSCARKSGRRFIEIPMMQALELE